MTKKYRHKPTGKIAEICYVSDWVNGVKDYYRVLGEPENIPSYCVTQGSDWEEIKEPEVPLGIVAFKIKEGDIDKAPKNHDYYETWVMCNLDSKREIHTIKVDGVEWSVGEKTDTAYTNKAAIEKFEYKGGYWWAFFNNGCYSKVDLIKKISTRKPIATLQGKELFEGDKYWYVSLFQEYSLHELYVEKNTIWNDRCFSTKELAQQYIRDNKPVYPAKLVEDFIENHDIGDWIATARAYNKLKEFKPKP